MDRLNDIYVKDETIYLIGAAVKAVTPDHSVLEVFRELHIEAFTLHEGKVYVGGSCIEYQQKGYEHFGTPYVACFCVVDAYTEQ